MENVHAIVEGNKIDYLAPYPITGRYEVTVIFNKRIDDDIEDKIKKMESLCGAWTEEDGKLIEEMISERKNFSKGREDYDFS